MVGGRQTYTYAVKNCNAMVLSELGAEMSAPVPRG